MRNVVLVSLLGLRGAIGGSSKFDKLTEQEYKRPSPSLPKKKLGRGQEQCPPLYLPVKTGEDEEVIIPISEVFDDQTDKVVGFKSGTRTFT